MSVKRPPKRYIGLRFEPPGATRKDVTRALEDAWVRARPPEGAPGPRLLVCEAGRAIVAVPRPLAPFAREAAEGAGPAGGGVRLTPVVTSGTVAGVKKRLGLGTRRPKVP